MGCTPRWPKDHGSLGSDGRRWLPEFNERGYGWWHATSGCPMKRCEASLAASSAASLTDASHLGCPGGTPYPPPPSPRCCRPSHPTPTEVDRESPLVPQELGCRQGSGNRSADRSDYRPHLLRGAQSRRHHHPQGTDLERALDRDPPGITAARSLNLRVHMQTAYGPASRSLCTLCILCLPHPTPRLPSPLPLSRFRDSSAT